MVTLEGEKVGMGFGGEGSSGVGGDMSRVLLDGLLWIGLNWIGWTGFGGVDVGVGLRGYDMYVCMYLWIGR